MQKIYIKNIKPTLFWPGVFLESELKLKDIELNEEVSINNEGQILEV